MKKSFVLLVALLMLFSSFASAQVQTTDVLVIGGGGAGLLAALTAADAGADVIVLEKMPFVGGATLISGAYQSAAVTKAQEREGIVDSAEDFFLDLMHGGEYTNDARLTWLLAERSGEVANYMEEVGVKFQPEVFKGFVEHRNPRSVVWEGLGPGLFQTLSKACEVRGIPVLLQTRAHELTQTNGKVDGAIATDKDGNEITFKADVVILATGGYGANMDMRPDHLKDVLFYGAVSSSGDGHLMAAAVGAELRDMHMMKIYHNGVEIGPGRARTLLHLDSVNLGAIYVNSDGKRQVNEMLDMVSIKKRQMAQDDNQLFLVLDQKMMDQLGPEPFGHTWPEEEMEKFYAKERGGFSKGNTLAEAAAKMGINADNLVATVEAYNSYVAQGFDPEFNRPHLPAPISEGPFYIFEQKPRMATTLGGLNVTLDMEVLDVDGNPIPGLLAAGEIIGGAHGNESMPGVCTSWAFTTGRVAGETAVQMLSK
ncbi:MAG: FAD-dependent oxidoreductase [Limnochordia bacterium]|jgi:flavocytochrome c